MQKFNDIELPVLPDTTAAPKKGIKQKAKETAKDGVKWAFWYGVAQLAVEVAKLIIHH